MGELVVFINHHQNTASHLPDKRFSIQITGRFLPRPDGRGPWSFDDVVFGVQLDRPVPWSSLPMPGWISKSLLRWIRSANNDLMLSQLFVDDVGMFENAIAGRVKGDRDDDDDDMRYFITPCYTAIGTGATVQALPQPLVAQSLICSASKFSIVVDSTDTNGGSHYTDTNNKWHYGPAQGRRHRFERELIEDNRPLFADRQLRSPEERRDHFRSTILIGHSLSKGLDGSATSQQPLNIQAIPRSIHYYDPRVTYMFELATDFFDFNTFDLRPKLSRRRRSFNGKQPPAAASLLLSGKWSMNMRDATAVQESANRHSRIMLACKNRLNDCWFFCMVFDFIE